MLSYRHGFHAGNHADVLKHLVLLEVINYFNVKPKPYSYIDTHAGAGLYSLISDFATKNCEFNSGISKLLDEDEVPELVESYINIIREYNSLDELKFYPGSPFIAYQAMRKLDNLNLFELHPTDAKILNDNCHNLGRRIKVNNKDGLLGLKAYLPPISRRALVLIDPPYELKDEYDDVVACIADALTRFPSGTYCIWYPLLPNNMTDAMLSKLKGLSKNWLNVSLQVHSKPLDFGMYGSGVFIINQPWTLKKNLEPLMVYLQKILGQDSNATFGLEEKIC